MLSDDCKNALYNYKFLKAEGLLDQGEPTAREVDVVKTLSRMLGNPGWFEGDLAFVVEAALCGIGVEFE